MAESVRIIELPKFEDSRGNLTFLQNNDHVPFEIQRVFWTYDVPGGHTRGGHAYKTQYEVIIALSGSFDVVIMEKDGTQKSYSMNRSYKGLFIPPKHWRYMENFSTNALGLHLSSSKFDESDYVYDIDKIRM